MDNKYQDRLDEHIRDMTNVMFTFEITKACGYSTFVTVYKENTLIDLYIKVIEHFTLNDLKELFFYSPTSERIRIPLSKQTISEFIKKHTNGLNNSVNLVPIYALPRPVIYRLYLHEGSCC